MSLKHAALTLIITIAIACASPTGGCSCSPPPTYSRYVAGFVRDSAGAPVTASVRALFYDRQCQGPPQGTGSLSVRGIDADAVGHYAFSLDFITPDTLCLRLVARSAADSVVQDRVSVPLMLPPIDTVRVDFVLPEVLVPRDVLVGTWSSVDATLAATQDGASLTIPCIAVGFPTLRLDDSLTFRAIGVVTRAVGLVTVHVGDAFPLSGRVVGNRVVIPWPWIVRNAGQDTLAPGPGTIQVCNA